jgi:hypothetical protein
MTRFVAQTLMGFQPCQNQVMVQFERLESWELQNVRNWAAIGKSRHCLNGKDWAVCGLSVYGFASSFGCRSATAMIGGREAHNDAGAVSALLTGTENSPSIIGMNAKAVPNPRVSLLPEQEIHGSLRTAQEIWWTGWIEEE